MNLKQISKGGFYLFFSQTDNYVDISGVFWYRAFWSAEKSFASRVEKSAALSANSLIDHRGQLAVKVSGNIIRSWRHRVVVKTMTTKSSFETQWWASKRLSLELKVAHYVRLVSLLQYCYDINWRPFNRKKNDRS